MLEQMDKKLDQQASAATELKNLLLEEIQLREHDQLRIAKLEDTVAELKSAAAGLHEKLNQMQRNIAQETLIMNKSFIVPPTGETEKPKTTQQRQTERQMGTNSTTDPDSTTGPATLKVPCYKNWDQDKQRAVNGLRLVRYNQLFNIVKSIFDMDVHSDDYILLKNKIKSLTILIVGKYERFPSTDYFRDINLNVKENAHLRDMLRATSGMGCRSAGEQYYKILTRQGALMEQWTFEAKHKLHWGFEPAEYNNPTRVLETHVLPNNFSTKKIDSFS